MFGETVGTAVARPSADELVELHQRYLRRL
jgi:hypothetical protein